MDTLLAFCTCIFSTWMNIQLPATWKCTGFNIVLHSVKSIHMEAAKTLQLFVFLRIPSILYQHWIITAQTHTHYCVTRITFFSFIEITAHSKHTKKKQHPSRNLGWSWMLSERQLNVVWFFRKWFSIRFCLELCQNIHFHSLMSQLYGVLCLLSLLQSISFEIFGERFNSLDSLCHEWQWYPIIECRTFIISMGKFCSSTFIHSHAISWQINSSSKTYGCQKSSHIHLLIKIHLICEMLITWE